MFTLNLENLHNGENFPQYLKTFDQKELKKGNSHMLSCFFSPHLSLFQRKDLTESFVSLNVRDCTGTHRLSIGLNRFKSKKWEIKKSYSIFLAHVVFSFIVWVQKDSSQSSLKIICRCVSTNGKKN